MVAVKLGPWQLFKKGNTVYTTVSVTPNTFESVWLTAVCGVEAALTPITPPVGLEVGMVHVYVVPDGAVAGVALNGVPLQICTGIFPNSGIGLETVSINENEGPAQLATLGIIVYTVCARELVTFNKVWEILDTGKVCAKPPVIEPAGVLTGAAQVNVVLFNPEEGLTKNEAPEQIVSRWSTITGNGFTGTVMENALPIQNAVAGTTV